MVRLLYVCCASSHYRFSSACFTEDDYGIADSLYRVVNFVIMVVGISSLYSLFNVISIIIKHGLNFLIKKLDRQCNCACEPFAKAQAVLTGHRRNAIIPRLNPGKRKSSAAPNGRQTIESVDRRESDEMIDVREFLQANKVSLAVMQKDLFESAQRGRTGFIGSPASHTPSPPALMHLRQVHANAHGHHHQNAHRSHSHGHDKDPDFTPGNIGPMSIVEHTLGDDA